MKRRKTFTEGTEFQKKLGEYMDRLPVQGKVLAEAAGVSPSQLSLWRSGKRVPKPDAQPLKQLAGAIAGLSGEGAPGEEAILADLQSSLASVPTVRFENLNMLMDLLEITTAQLSRQLKYDASYISRIRKGTRHPANAAEFSEGLCACVLRKLPAAAERTALSKLLGVPAEALADDGDCAARITDWLFRGEPVKVDYIGRFLTKLEGFDLNQYTRTLDFSGVSLPAASPDSFPAGSFFGLEEMKLGELAFFGCTVASPSEEPIFLYSNMPMADMGQDLEFGRKWIFALASALRKGLHFDVIHNVDRPLEEMLLGLESWIPLYMTGQVTPYYFSGPGDRDLCSLTYVSGAAALSGLCVQGKHGNGRYTLFREQRDVAFFRQLSDDMLERAKPLMNIYRTDSKAALDLFLQADVARPGKRRGILPAPPIYTLSPELLERILRRSGVSEKRFGEIEAFVRAQRKNAEAVLETNAIADEFRLLSPEEFDAAPVSLSLSLGFFDTDILYTREEYEEHIRLTEEFARTHSNYSVEFSSRRAFRNIQITLHEGQWAMVSKSQSPTIHFVIRHPKLRSALEK